MTSRKEAVGRYALARAAFVSAAAIVFISEGSWTSCRAEDPIAAADNISTIEEEADKCLRPADAIALYTGFLAQADLPPDVRLKAEKKLELWKDREQKGLRRAGKAWVTPEVLVERSTALIKAGLTFRKLGNKRFARAEMQKASDLDQTSGTAEMWLGVFDFWDREYLTGMRHFQEAARREPMGAEAFSNAAVSGYLAGRTTRVADDFRCAIERAGMGVGVGVAENMSIVLALHSGAALDSSLRKFKSMPTAHLDDLKTVYQQWLKDASIDLDHIAGFTLFVPDLPPGFDGPTFEANEIGKAIPPAQSGGTGFVIAPQFVITNNHVIEGVDMVTIMTQSQLRTQPDSTTPSQSGDEPQNKSGLAAEVVFRDPKVDLALLKCDTLDLPPLKMRLKTPRRGTELLSLGFPSFFKLGTSIKSTGGKVVSEPESFADLKSIFYHDATINRGNSGGPLVDDTAAIIGVNVAFLGAGGAVDNPMYMGIPVEEVWSLLKSSGCDVPAQKAESATAMKWPDVDEVVSESTVLILTEKKGGFRR